MLINFSRNSNIIFIVNTYYYNELIAKPEDSEYNRMILNIFDVVSFDDSTKVMVLSEMFIHASLTIKGDILVVLKSFDSYEVFKDCMPCILKIFNCLSENYRQFDDAFREEEDIIDCAIDIEILTFYMHMKHLVPDVLNFILSVKACYFEGRECADYDFDNITASYFDYFLFYTYSHEILPFTSNEISIGSTNLLRDYNIFTGDLQ